ncbi:DUF5908 family protein [Rhizobacter sp. Root1221]|uniref:DUF5908 family protein n=1 Tax=Rhizobacter sp. Root1221 TaxID=1736433 RepID=UPI000A68493C|nr:DUF5908 family protein [Rhizobacter sp. Root1221]
MTIEVRQLLIKSQVNTAPASPLPAGLNDQHREQVKDEILAECKAWLAQKLVDARER